MFKRVITAIVFLFSMSWVQADSLDIQLSNQSARFTYASEVFGGQLGPTDLEFGGYFNEDDDTLLHLGLLVRNDTLDNPLVISIGARVYYGDVGNNMATPPADAAAIALGGELLFIPDNLGGLGFGVYYFIAPSVISFMDADGFREFGLIVDYAITEQASFYAGYRNIEVTLDTGFDIEVDSSFIYGVSLRF